MTNPLDLIQDAHLELPGGGPSTPRIALIVLGILAGGLLVAWLVMPDGARVEDCGALAELGADDDEDAPELAHDLECRARLEVQGNRTVVVGPEAPAGAPPDQRFANVRIYARVKSPRRIVVALPRGDRAVDEWLARAGHLGGFRTAVRGRFVDADRSSAALAATVRQGLDLGGDPFFIFEPAP